MTNGGRRLHIVKSAPNQHWIENVRYSVEVFADENHL
jgi:hypothetical protein